MDILFGFSSASLIVFVIIFLAMYKVEKYRKNNIDYEEEGVEYIELGERNMPQSMMGGFAAKTNPMISDYIQRARGAKR